MLLYFAYGSNMHPARLAARTPSARSVGVGKLPGHSLRFHKRGRDGSGKCDALFTADPADAVLGVVYTIAEAERPLLDTAEGVGYGYHVVDVRVETVGGPCTAFCYLAQREHIDPALRPFGWYHALVTAGARVHGLPADYIAFLDATEVIHDRDGERHRAHMKIVTTH